MGYPTPIEWTDATWNPFGGCSVTSPGCTNCYAMRIAGSPRLRNHPLYAGVTSPSKAGPVFNGRMTVAEPQADVWSWPLRWRGSKTPKMGAGKPSMIFVGDMADLFHESRLDDVIDRVFATMALAPQHIFQVLTKRAERMRDYFKILEADVMERASDRITMAINSALILSGKTWGQCGSTSTHVTTINGGRGAREPGMLRGTGDGGVEQVWGWKDEEKWFRLSDKYAAGLPSWMKGTEEFGWNFKMWPLPNVWLGFSAGDQQRFDERWEHMRDLAEAGWRIFVSIEPALGPVVLPPEFLAYGNRSWVIWGGESGPNARPAHPAWEKSLRHQCRDAGVPFFRKQWGEWRPAPEIIDARGSLFHRFDDGTWCQRVGKKAAGARVDGREHREWPA